MPISVILNEVRNPDLCGRGALTPRGMADEGVRPQMILRSAKKAEHVKKLSMRHPF
jgi:hypothetical protein